jgi:lipoate---protein ligase
MLCLQLHNPDPYFCLAAEEFLMKNYQDDIFMIWQSQNAVIVGKHQNTLGEINYRYVRENNVRVARRISGGGTVFHDEGNINFVFIRNVESPAVVSFRMFLKPVADFLGKLGVMAEISGHNDLLATGKKISGNAQHVYKNRVLHHGTLLYDSDLDKLGNAIRVVPGKYSGKAVQSNRSMVANIRSMLPDKLTTSQFIQKMFDFLLISYPGSRFHDLSEDEIRDIASLATSKFASWDWCFGYSPKYVFRNELSHRDTLLKIELSVEKGMIVESRCAGSFPEIPELNHFLTGIRHSYAGVREAAGQCLQDLTEEQVYCFF